MECSMNHKVAIAFDNAEKIAPFPDASCIKILKRAQGEWKTVGEVPCRLAPDQGIAGVREAFKKVVEELGDCKVLIASSISGVFYTILDAAGFGIYEAQEYSPKLLDAVLRDANHQQEATGEEAEEEVETTPTKTDVAGNYYFDLIKLQRYKPDISSKKALIPFLQDTAFYQLEIRCSHIPPWFDIKLPEMNLTFESALLKPGEYKATIYKKVCSK